MKLLSYLLDFIYPPACPCCAGRVLENGYLCAECFSKFNWISDPKCACCGYPFPADLDLGPTPLCPICANGKNVVDWCRAACVYDDMSRSVMLPFKHASAFKYKDLMSRAMINSLRELNVGAGLARPINDRNEKGAPTAPLQSVDIVIPVPLAFWRLFKRGYNQATLLARPIAKHLNVPMDLHSVKRKYKPDMGHKNARQRRENIRGVFNVRHPENIRGKVILLVDDVMTTGATFYEMRRILKKAGAKAVYGVVFCRVAKAI